MLKINFSLLLISTFFLNAISQESRYPVKPGSVWRINYEFCCGWDGDNTISHSNGDEEYKYFVDGDTLISNKNYYKLYKNGILFLDNPFKIEHKYMGAIRDSANRFYFVEKENSVETLLYNFDAKAGEPMQPDGIPVFEIDTLENGRRTYLFDIITVHCGSANTIIEGIGWLGGLLEGNSCSGHPGVRGSYLVCYTEDEEIIYLTEQMRGDQPVECNLTISSVSKPSVETAFSDILLKDKELKITLRFYPAEKACIEIFTITGVKVLNTALYNKENLLDLNQVANGVYMVRLRYKNYLQVAELIVN
jgi:hypothetical protein